MRKIKWITVFLGVVSSNLYAAQCKVDGKWYDYGSTQCSQNRTQPSQAHEPKVINENSGPEPNYGMPPDIEEAAWPVCQDYNRTHEQQVSCMKRESRGYAAWNGYFDLPKDRLETAKKGCEKQFDLWWERASCMRIKTKKYKEEVSEENDGR